MRKLLLFVCVMVMGLITVAAPVAAQDGGTLPPIDLFIVPVDADDTPAQAGGTAASPALGSRLGGSTSATEEVGGEGVKANPTATPDSDDDSDEREDRDNDEGDPGYGQVIITGVPDRAENYEMAMAADSIDDYVEGGPFVCTLPRGLCLLLGWPGVLLTHDEPQAHQDRFSPLTQLPLQEADVETGCGESRFIKVVSGHSTVELERANGEVVTVQMLHHFGNNHWLYVRCPYSDGLQNSDMGADVTVSDFKAGFGHVLLYPDGGFIAEDAEGQALPSTLHGFTAGSEGAEYLTVTELDLNTGAYVVYGYTEEDGWELLDSNMDPDDLVVG